MPARVPALLVSLLLFVGCDGPNGLGLEPGKATPTRPAAPPAREATTPTAPAGAGGHADTSVHGGFTDCLLRCDGAPMNRADKAKCRYQCEDLASPAPYVDTRPIAANDPDPVGSAVGCLKLCGPRGGQVAGCADACKATAAASPVAPSAAVLDELVACVSACQHDAHLNETDHATCELTCAEAARVAGPARFEIQATKAQ